MGDEDEMKIDSPAPRRSFLKQGLAGIVGLAAAGAMPIEGVAAPVSDDQFPQITLPLESQRLLKSEATGEPPRQQQYTETELIGGNDVKILSKAYQKRTDLGETYDSVTLNVSEFYRQSNDPSPVKTSVTAISVSGIKGQVEGDYRTDTITTTISTPLGITTDGPKQIKVLLKSPNLGTLDQEMLDRMVREKLGGMAEPKGGG